jgi:hypothetical protein
MTENVPRSSFSSSILKVNFALFLVGTMFRKIMHSNKILPSIVLPIVLIMSISAATRVFADEPEYSKIREGMKKLLPLIGKWDVAVAFYDPDGTITNEVGTWNVSSVLDDTYLEFQTERHLKDNPKRHRLVLFYVTFNPRSNRYDITFFYNWSALRVIIRGEFDDGTQEFRTRGYIPAEDSVNDETVSETFSLKDHKRIVYKHYSMRSPRETAQRLDVEMILTPAK